MFFIESTGLYIAFAVESLQSGVDVVGRAVAVLWLLGWHVFMRYFELFYFYFDG